MYRERSSLEKDLGFSAKALYGVSYHRHEHYHPAKVPEGNGEFRELCVPDKFLKTIQRRITERLLVYEEISPFATAYRTGGSTLVNATPHVGNPVLLKLDICHFFDHIIYPMVKEKAFPAERYSEANRILLSLLFASIKMPCPRAHPPLLPSPISSCGSLTIRWEHGVCPKASHAPAIVMT